MAEYNYFLATLNNDVITTEGGDPILLYTLTDNLMYVFGIDWGSDGSYADESDRILRWSCDRGREKIIRPSGSGFNPYEIGRLTVELENHDGRYDPWNTAGALYGNIEPGLDINFSTLTYNSTATDGHDNHLIFTGTLVDIQINGYNKTVTLIAEDGWRYLADWQLFRPPYVSSSLGVEGNLYYEVIEYTRYFNPATLLYENPGPKEYPWGVVSGYDFDVNADLYVPRHWWWDGTAKGAIEMITFGSLGRSWVRTDNKFDFDSLDDTTDAAVATLDEDTLLRDIYIPVPWENYRSEVVLRGSRRTWYGNQNLTNVTEPTLIETSGTVDINLRYEYSDISTIYCTRVVSVTATANAAADGSGANMTTDISTLTYPYDTSIRLELTNAASTDAYITSLVVNGETLEVIPEVWRFEDTTAHRKASFVLDSDWLSVTSIGQAGGYLKETTNTTNDKDRIDRIGNSLLQYLSTVRPFPTVQIQGRYDDQFDLELEDKVTLTAPTKGINDDFRVTKIAHRSMGTPQDVLTTLWLYPPITPATT